MSERRGIQRHESLKPLSRHHMIGLHVALKLKRAGTEKSRLTLDEIIEDTRSFWLPDGQTHFREEEEILLPAFAGYGDINQQDMIDMLLEHVQIRAGMNDLLVDDDPSLADMRDLSERLEAHIRKEERVIFPIIEAALPEEKLLELAPFLH